MGNAGLLGKMAIFDIEFHERFHMLADKRKRIDNDGHPLRARTPNFIVGGGPNPLQRPDTALIA